MLRNQKKRVQSSSQNYRTNIKELLSLNSNLSERKKIQSLPRPSVRHQRYKSQTYEDRSQIKQISHSNKLVYNKWYIRPQVRMKKPVFSHHKSVQGSTSNQEFVYEKLYEQKNVDEKDPFKYIQSDKVQFLNKIPINNMKLLQGFKKNQERNRKRVPKLVDLLLKKKLSSKFPNPS